MKNIGDDKNMKTVVVDLGNYNVKYLADRKGIFSSKYSTKFNANSDMFERIEIDSQLTFIGVGEYEREFNKVDKNYLPLLLYAIDRATNESDINLCLLLPVSQMSNKDKLINSLKGNTFTFDINGKDRRINIDKVAVLAEGFVSYYSIEEGDKDDILIIDVGSRTINYSSFIEGKLEKNFTEKLGVFDLYSTIKDIQNSAGGDYVEEDIERLIKNNKMINCILNEANMYTIFKESCKSKLKYRYRNDIQEGIKHNTHIENNELLYTYQSDDFKILRDNINILGLEICFNSECVYKLIVVPYEYTKKNEEKNLISQWLEESYPEISKSYVDAIKAYSNGDSVGTLTHCRNVITGIFTYDKIDRTKWYTGLQKACINDKNINMISKPASISSWSNNNVHDEKPEKRYNYPRFKTIVQVYSFLSDLGPHINEAPLKDGEPDYESTNSADALWGLRMTEDILIWIYNNK
jgi:plasmid segregation protein ParM